MSLSRPFVAFAVVAGFAIGSTSAKAAVLIQIDKSAQRMSVSVDGMERWSWPVSTGQASYATPSGSYRPFRMEATHFSKEWDDAPMPHSIFFTKVGHAIHGTYDAAHLGAAVSHGCVRISAANATQLYQLVKTEGMANTQVVISGQQPYAEPQAYNQGQGFFGQSRYDQNNYGQNSYGRNPSSQSWFGQNSYGQNSYGQSSYAQSSYGQTSYRQSSSGQSVNGRRNARPNERRGDWFFGDSRH
jgi:hypothetical protein